MRKFWMVISSLLFLVSSPVSAQEVDFLWQGNTYTPPFYKGRALWSNQSEIIIYAVPHIEGVNPNTLYYKWSRNGTALGGPQGANGVDKSTLTLFDSVLGKSQTIKLELLADNGAVLANESIVITPRPASLLVYEENPLYGYLFQKEVSGVYAFQSEEVTLAAFPLFFNTPNRSADLVSYAWRTNPGNNQVGSSVTYRAPEGTKGEAEVRVEAKHKTSFIQTANKIFGIKFGAQ